MGRSQVSRGRSKLIAQFGNRRPFAEQDAEHQRRELEYNQTLAPVLRSSRLVNASNNPCRLHGIPWRQCTLCAPAPPRAR